MYNISKMKKKKLALAIALSLSLGGGPVWASVNYDADTKTKTIQGDESGRDFYGGQGEQGSGYTLEITGGTTTMDQIYGGIGEKEASSNTLRVTGDGAIQGENVFGGSATYYEQKPFQQEGAKYNEVRFESTGKTDVKNIYGGYTRTGMIRDVNAGNATNNKVILTKGDITVNCIYGGNTEAGEANQNSVLIEGNTKLEMGEKEYNTSITDRQIVGGSARDTANENQVIVRTITPIRGTMDRMMGGSGLYQTNRNSVSLKDAKVEICDLLAGGGQWQYGFSGRNE